jgi:hypothetical protein
VATVCRKSNVGLSPEAKVSPTLVHQWEAVVHAGTIEGDEVDYLSVEMDEAKCAVETALRPFVVTPTLRVFARI